MNNTIPFVEEEDLEESMLYEPVKALAPLMFPNIIKSKENELKKKSKHLKKIQNKTHKSLKRQMVAFFYIVKYLKHFYFSCM